VITERRANSFLPSADEVGPLHPSGLGQLGPQRQKRARPVEPPDAVEESQCTRDERGGSNQQAGSHGLGINYHNAAKHDGGRRDVKERGECLRGYVQYRAHDNLLLSCPFPHPSKH